MRQYKSRRAKKEAMEAYLFLLPFLVGVSIFNVYAFVQNIIISFTNKKSLGQAKFVGLSNYVKLFADAKFYQAIQNTLLYVVICVPAVIILALVIAVALNQKIKGMGIYRTLIYLPVITLPTAEYSDPYGDLSGDSSMVKLYRSMESVSDPETVCEHLYCHDPVNRQSDPGLFPGSLCVCQTEVSGEKSAVSVDPQHDDDSTSDLSDPTL